MANPSQEDCKLEFAAAMILLAETLEKIDEKTPAGVTEPEWWLRMMDLHRTALSYARQYSAP